MLDWCVTNGESRYKLALPPLTKEEEQLVFEVSKTFQEMSKHREVHKSQINLLIAEQLVDYCRQHNIRLDHDQEVYISSYLRQNIIGYCGIDQLLEDDQIEEIAIIGVNKPTYIYRVGSGWQSTNHTFISEETVTAVINKMARPVGRRVTYQNPTINAVLPNGARLHASIPPISDIELTIRKFRTNPITVPELVDRQTYSADAIAFLSLVFQLDYNILIAGNTASGKTSTLNALFSFVPISDRILLIEETPEINIPHQHKVKMVSNSGLNINMRALVEDTLRMRPDRVIVGEVRTREEVSAFIETILSGQARGSYATFHAQSSEEAVKRMVSQGVSSLDVGSINYIVVQRRIIRYDPNARRHWEERKGVEIAEIDGDSSSINKLFQFNSRNGTLEGDYTKSSNLQAIADSFGISVRELSDEIEKRKQLFSSLKGRQFDDTVYAIQSSLFSQDYSSQDNMRAIEGAERCLNDGAQISKKTFSQQI